MLSLFLFFCLLEYVYSSWTMQTDAASIGAQYWQSIASSSDGSNLATVVYSGNIYHSSNAGYSWTKQSDAQAIGPKSWYSISSSSDGTKLAAVAYNSNY